MVFYTVACNSCDLESNVVMHEDEDKSQLGVCGNCGSSDVNVTEQ